MAVVQSDSAIRGVHIREIAECDRVFFPGKCAVEETSIRSSRSCPDTAKRSRFHMLWVCRQHLLHALHDSASPLRCCRHL